MKLMELLVILQMEIASVLQGMLGEDVINALKDIKETLVLIAVKGTF